MKLRMMLILFLFVGLGVCACSKDKTDTKKDDTQITTTEAKKNDAPGINVNSSDTAAGNINNSSVQSETPADVDQEFREFFAEFKQAVVNNDMRGVIRFTEFPFNLGMTFDRITINETKFKEEYPLMFDKDIRKVFASDKKNIEVFSDGNREIYTTEIKRITNFEDYGLPEGLVAYTFAMNVKIFVDGNEGDFVDGIMEYVFAKGENGFRFVLYFACC